MAEEEAKDVKDQETIKPEADSKENVQETQSKEPKEGSKEYNFARLREQKEQAERRNAELEGKIKELEKVFSKEEESSSEIDELSKLDPDDILTVSQATKLSERQAKKIVQEMLEKKEFASLPERTKNQFNDFDAVMTEENIKKLETQEPGLAAACAKAPNPWEATYKILKKFILPQQEDKGNKGNERMKENLSTPVSSNSVGRNSPLSNANIWSDASKEELYKEMMQAARKA